MTIPYLVLITFALVSLQGTCSYVVYGLTDTELFKACYRNRRNQQKQENTKEGDETLSINPPIKSKLSSIISLVVMIVSRNIVGQMIMRFFKEIRRRTRILSKPIEFQIYFFLLYSLS
ncbi:unnamed protein product [Heterobilharzia americana]|nr:unnamed protein product [Heterobilharzia americana]